MYKEFRCPCGWDEANRLVEERESWAGFLE